MYFFVKTNNPRPTFQLDMTLEERETMNRHVAYWTKEAKAGKALVFGPVGDPKGVYGILIYEAATEAEIQDKVQHDPARGLLQYEILPMIRAVIKESWPISGT